MEIIIFMGGTIVGSFLVLLFSKKDCLVSEKGHGKRCFSVLDTPGEHVLLEHLKKGLSKEEYFIFNNLILPFKKGGSSQIDHLLVSRFGIFVLENKDYRGWIFGNAYRAKWTKTFRNGFKVQFPNPIWQNYGHIKALQENIGGMDDKYFNIVAFSGRSEIRTKLPGNILFYSEVVDYIKTFKEEKIPPAKMEQILGKVFGLCQTVDITNEDHIKYLKKKFGNE